MSQTAIVEDDGGRIKVTPVSGALGAEIEGIDLANLDDATFATIYEAFLRHHVLMFHDQELSPDAYLAFATRFGAPADYPFVKGLESHPRIIEIIKEPEQTTSFGGRWHSDTTYLDVPPKATMLYALETPLAGGDTAFANMHLAYETLSEGLCAVLDSQRVLNSSAMFGRTLRGDHLGSFSMEAKELKSNVFEAEHPAVSVHPETGRKALNVNPAHTQRFSDMTAAESEPLLDYLFDHGVRPEFTCRLRWRPGSVAVWDNRSVWHTAINDYDGHRRVMRRITIEGDAPA